MRTVLAVLCLCLPLHAHSPMETAIRKLLQSRPAPYVLLGIHVIDLKSGRVLVDINGASPAAPASNTKLFSTALALRRLGPDYRYETRLMSDAEPDAAGHVEGSLRLVGSGEPSPSIEEFARLLWDRNVRSVAGDVIGDDSLYPWEPYPDGWTVDDTLYEYGAPVSALSVGGNVLPFVLLPQQPGSPALLSFGQASDFYTLLNETISASSGAGTLEWRRDAGSRVVTISGRITRQRTEAIAVQEPALFAAHSLLEALRARGVRVEGRALAIHRRPGEPYAGPEGVVLVRRNSPPVSELVAECNRNSNNLYAELLLREAARLRQGDGSLANGLAEMKAFLGELDIDPLALHLEDGSGLSRKTLTAPSAITRLLAAMAASAEFFDSLPVPGREGTLKLRFGGVSGAHRLRAKTGSYRHVTALSGYVDRRVAFSILANQVTAPDSTARLLVDRIAVEILRRSPQP